MISDCMFFTSYFLKIEKKIGSEITYIVWGYVFATQIVWLSWNFTSKKVQTMIFLNLFLKKRLEFLEAEICWYSMLQLTWNTLHFGLFKNNLYDSPLMWWHHSIVPPLRSRYSSSFDLCTDQLCDLWWHRNLGIWCSRRKCPNISNSWQKDPWLPKCWATI